jgi:hypothetical protein
MVMAWLRPTFHEIRRSVGGENHCYRPPTKCEDNVACATKNVHFIEAIEDQEEGELKPSKPDEAYKPEDVTPAEHTKKVPLCKDVPDRTVIIGKGLDEAEQARLVQFLRNNQDVFTWTSSDMRGVSRGVMEHSLRVVPKIKLRKQHLRTMSEEQKQAAQAEVQKLLDVGVIREVAS